MALRNLTLTVKFTVWDTANNVGKAGDAANLTLRIIKDGGPPAVPANVPASEPDITNLPGVYELVLTAAEMDADFVTLGGKSGTADTVVIPTYIHTEAGVLPLVAPGSNGGLPTVNASNEVSLDEDIVADHVLRRTYANARLSAVGDALSGRSLLGAIGKLVNKVALAGATLTVFQEDDTTTTAPGTGPGP